jgi:hypothetical protein
VRGGVKSTLNPINSNYLLLKTNFGIVELSAKDQFDNKVIVVVAVVIHVSAAPVSKYPTRTMPR